MILTRIVHTPIVGFATDIGDYNLTTQIYCILRRHPPTTTSVDIVYQYESTTVYIFNVLFILQALCRIVYTSIYIQVYMDI